LAVQVVRLISLLRSVLMGRYCSGIRDFKTLRRSKLLISRQLYGRLVMVSNCSDLRVAAKWAALN
jgi:hypothetical protein